MGCSIGVVKYLVFIFNFIFLLCGLGIITYGVILKIHFKDDISISPIVFGAAVFTLAFFGCCAAIKESSCMLIIYAVILIIVVVASMIFGLVVILWLSTNSEGHELCRSNLQAEFHNYIHSRNEEFLKAQEESACCGIEGPEDYTTSTLPANCCQEMRASCKKGDEDVHKRGCIIRCDFEYKELQILGITIIIIALIELTGAIFALVLASSIQNQWRRGTTYA